MAAHSAHQLVQAEHRSEESDALFAFSQSVRLAIFRFYSISTAIAVASPPPMHSAATPFLRPF
jgi:hypothetical protein